jgi:hypothetical protein
MGRIHGELVKIGIGISQGSVVKYRVRHRRPPSQTWRTFGGVLKLYYREIA